MRCRGCYKINLFSSTELYIKSKFDVNWPTLRVSKADVSNVSPSLVFCSDKRLLLETSAWVHASKCSFGGYFPLLRILFGLKTVFVFSSCALPSKKQWSLPVTDKNYTQIPRVSDGFGGVPISAY